MADTPNESNGRQPIPPAKRKMLQTWFEFGSKAAAGGNFDYATDMFGKCVTGDPANVIYAQNFLGNLQKKYNNNKSGAKLASVRTAGSKTAAKNAARKKDWNGVIASGIEVLKLNPWDVSALSDIAHACEQMQLDDCEAVYLKGALDYDIKDVDVNRLMGRCLARLGQFDAAIACWVRVKQAKPNDEEAHRAIQNLTAQKTIDKGGYEDAQSSTQVMADKQAQAERQGTGGNRLSPEEQLEKQIKKDPTNMSLYLELMDLHLKAEKFAEAEALLERGLQASGGSLEMRERLEDVQLRHARHEVNRALQRAEAEKTDEAAELYQRMKAELNQKELEVYRSRCDRYPQNLGFRYELGERLRRAAMFTEAIKVLQEARNDPKRKGLVALSLGLSFESIKQYKLALSNYEQAIDVLGDRDADQKKASHYRAGCVAMDRLKDYDVAEKHLTAVASLDFGYKDISQRLDKLHELRENSGQ